MSDILGAVTLAIHLLAVNVAAAGPLVAAWLASRGRAGLPVGRRVVWQSLAGLSVGAVLGGGLLLTASERMQAALTRFPASTYWFAGMEIAFSAACVGGMLLAIRADRARPWLAWLLALASASNLLYHFPPLMTVIGKLANDSLWARERVITREVLNHQAMRPEVLAFWVHFTLASIAAAAIIASALAPRDASRPEHERLFRRLAGAALAATLAQLPVGVWLLVAGGSAERDAMLGERLVASAAFMGGVIAALALAYTLAMIMLGDAAPNMRRRSGWLLVTVAVLMSATLMASRRERRVDRARQGSAKPPAVTTIEPVGYFASGSLLASSSVPPGNVPA
jgi:hypothetical protein